MNKKGMGLSMLAGIGFLLAVCLFLVISNDARVLDKDSSRIGAIPLDVMRARYEGEKALLFLDYSAKYSLPYAILKTGERGGLVDVPCGRYISPLWNDEGRLCPPSPKSALMQAFDERLHVYLNQYPNLPVYSYQYAISDSQTTVDLMAFSTQDLGIPVTMSGTGFAELSDVGGGLVFPVEGSPVVTSCFGDRMLSGIVDNHDGVDFQAGVGTKIYAIAPGQVVSVCEEWVGVCDCSVANNPRMGRACSPADNCKGKCGDLGNTLVIKHAENFYSRYSHLSSVEVQAGDQIAKGMFIGFSGDTGYSEGPHLDLKVYTSGDTGANQGKNPFCVYADEQLASLSSFADSCQEEMAGGVFKKENFKLDCSRIDPQVYARVVSVGNQVPEDVRQTETTERSGKVRDEIVAKVNAYQDVIAKYARLAGVEEADLKAIMTHETVDIDPNAKSPSNPPALGLMQIVPSQNHDVCVRECGFSSKVDEQEYFDPEKNICCAAFIAKSKWRDAPKVYPACCNRQGCVNEDREYVGREAMYRGYNGWGCGDWGDPHYVEVVMGYYSFYGGDVQSAYRAYDAQIGTYRVRPNFRAEYAYNLSVYDEVFGFVRDEILEKFNGTMADELLEEKIALFNTKNPGLVMKRFCSDYPAAYQFAEEYADCLLAEDECLCNLSIDTDIVKKAYDLILTNVSLQVRKAGGIASDFQIFFPDVRELVSFNDVKKEYFQLSLDASGGSLDYERAKEYYLEKKAKTLTFTHAVDESLLCKKEKEYYSLCVEDAVMVDRVSGSVMSSEPVRLHFSVMLVPDFSSASVIEQDEGLAIVSELRKSGLKRWCYAAGVGCTDECPDGGTYVGLSDCLIDHARADEKVYFYFVPLKWKTRSGPDYDFESMEQFESVARDRLDILKDMYSESYRLDVSETFVPVFSQNWCVVDVIYREFATVESELAKCAEAEWGSDLDLADPNVLVGFARKTEGAGGWDLAGGFKWGMLVSGIRETTLAHEYGHELGYCDEYSYDFWNGQNTGEPCPNPYPVCCHDAPDHADPGGEFCQTVWADGFSLWREDGLCPGNPMLSDDGERVWSVMGANDYRELYPVDERVYR